MDGIRQRRRDNYDCPVDFALGILAGKWKARLLAKLKEQPLAYGELKRLFPNLSDKVLTERLRELEADGLVDRKRASDGRLRYTVTSRAAGLQPMLQALHQWGQMAAAEMGIEIRE